MTGTVSELLPVDQFAQRLHLSRATVFSWMQKGILQQGRHYLKFGRVLRFVWSAELIASLLSDSANDQRVTTVQVRTSKPAKANPINWDY